MSANPRAPAPVDPLLWALLAAGSVAAVVPLWVTDVLPLQDLPGHLATARVLHDMARGPSLYHHVYIEAPGPLPNTLFFALCHWLAYLMPLVTAAKVVLSAAAVALPLASAFLLRALGRPVWLALFSLFLVYSYPLGRGFVAYTTGIPILLVALALAHRDAVGPTLRNGILLAAAVAASFYAHAQIYLTVMLYGAAVVVLSWEGTRAFVRRLVPYAVGSAPFAVWFVRYFVVRDTHAPVSYDAASKGFGATWDTVPELLSSLRYFVVAIFPSSLDEVALVVIGCTLVALLVLAFASRAEARPLPGLRRHTLLVLAALSVACFFLVPAHMKGQASISYRFVPLAVLFLGFSGGFPRRRAAAFGLAVALTAATVVFHAQVAREFVRFQHLETGDLKGLLELAEPGRRLGYVRLDRRTYTTLEMRSAWYLDSYYAVYRHGLVRMNFHYTYPNHVAYAPGNRPPRLPVRSAPAFFDRGLDRAYDYVLVFATQMPDFGPHNERVRLLGQSRHLHLYEVLRPPDPPRAEAAAPDADPTVPTGAPPTDPPTDDPAGAPPDPTGAAPSPRTHAARRSWPAPPGGCST